MSTTRNLLYPSAGVWTALAERESRSGAGADPSSRTLRLPRVPFPVRSRLAFPGSDVPGDGLASPVGPDPNVATILLIGYLFRCKSRVPHFKLRVAIRGATESEFSGFESAAVPGPGSSAKCGYLSRVRVFRRSREIALERVPRCGSNGRLTRSTTQQKAVETSPVIPTRGAGSVTAASGTGRSTSHARRIGHARFTLRPARGRLDRDPGLTLPPPPRR